MWRQCLVLLKVFHAVSGGSSPKYVWPICSKSFNFEVQDGGQTHPIIDASHYQFIGPHPSIPCDPINFDGSTYTHMDLPVNNNNQFDKLSFCVFIKATDNTGTVLHYRSDDGNQNIIMSVDAGKAVVSYDITGSVNLELTTATAALVVNNWYLLSFIQYDKGTSVQILLTKQASHWQKQSVQSVPYPLTLPGTIRIGSRFDAVGSAVSTVKRFQGQMICLAMYDSEFSYVDFQDSLDSCASVSFPANSALPTTPPPPPTTTTPPTTTPPTTTTPPPVVCSSLLTTHKLGNDTLFSKLADRAFMTSIRHLDQKHSTTLRKCATYCAISASCVAFTVTNVADELKTCRLFDVFDFASVVADIQTSVYVLDSCRFL